MRTPSAPTHFHPGCQPTASLNELVLSVHSPPKSSRPTQLAGPTVSWMPSAAQSPVPVYCMPPSTAGPHYCLPSNSITPHCQRQLAAAASMSDRGPLTVEEGPVLGRSLPAKAQVVSIPTLDAIFAAASCCPPTKEKENKTSTQTFKTKEVQLEKEKQVCCHSTSTCLHCSP